MSTTTAKPISPNLDEPTRDFVRRALRAGLVEIDQIKKVVVSLMADHGGFDPKRLADGLIGAGYLTRWQANKLLAGAGKGFHLGSYQLQRPLGRGGMGVVYLGRHTVMNRLMALKILPPEATKDPRRIERFKSEARASAQLDHPNVVRAYDFAEADGKVFIVMEYVDGIDLHYLIARDGPMSPASATDAIAQTIDALIHAHDRGIIHRDIKPSNLMLRTDGVVKLSDLGLARIGWTDADNKDPHRMLGTADFLAPEQAINSKTVDARADIYSLGCTWYYLLTGKPPYDSGSLHQRLAKHQTAAVPDVRAERNDCPAAIAELIMRMMSKRPEDRPQSAKELLTQLRRLSGSAGHRDKQSLRRVAPAGDTIADQSFYQATLSDRSLASGDDSGYGGDQTEFDFDALPPISGDQIVLQPRSPVALTPPRRTAAANKTIRSAGESNQQLLLGVGLAVAFIALIAVIGMGAYSILRDEDTPPVKLKTMEDGKGNVIVVR